jgi:molybdate transport system ATP-binding protein
MILLAKNVSLPLADFTLRVDFEARGRITVIFGPSGSGKTSLLDLVAGLRRPQSALIQVGDRVLTDTARGVRVPARRRGIGYVPQDLALFPHLSVRGNLLFGHRPGNDPRFHLDHVAELLEIQPLLDRGVAKLSGGEKQRVALARALLASPQLLLLDEPLASLDLPLKARILPFLTRVRDEFQIPMLYVTHDRYETLALADRMVVLCNGTVVQTGTVAEVFGRPANLAVAGIVAVETIQPGRVTQIAGGVATVAIDEVLLSAVEPGLPPGAADVHVCIRAEDVALTNEGNARGSQRNHLPGVIKAITPEGPLVRVDLYCGFSLAALLTKQSCEDLALHPGARTVAVIKAPHVHLIPR